MDDTKTTHEAPAYEAPRIEDHGDLTELTAGRASGTVFDGNFTAGQPIPAGFATTP